MPSFKGSLPRLTVCIGKVLPLPETMPQTTATVGSSQSGSLVPVASELFGGIKSLHKGGFSFPEVSVRRRGIRLAVTNSLAPIDVEHVRPFTAVAHLQRKHVKQVRNASHSRLCGSLGSKHSGVVVAAGFRVAQARGGSADGLGKRQEQGGGVSGSRTASEGGCGDLLKENAGGAAESKAAPPAEIPISVPESVGVNVIDANGRVVQGWGAKAMGLLRDLLGAGGSGSTSSPSPGERVSPSSRVDGSKLKPGNFEAMGNVEVSSRIGGEEEEIVRVESVVPRVGVESVCTSSSVSTVVRSDGDQGEMAMAERRLETGGFDAEKARLEDKVEKGKEAASALPETASAGSLSLLVRDDRHGGQASGIMQVEMVADGGQEVSVSERMVSRLQSEEEATRSENLAAEAEGDDAREESLGLISQTHGDRLQTESVVPQLETLAATEDLHTSLANGALLEQFSSVAGESSQEVLADSVGPLEKIHMSAERRRRTAGSSSKQPTKLHELLTVPGIGPRNMEKFIAKGILKVAELKQLYRDKFRDQQDDKMVEFLKSSIGIIHKNHAMSIASYIKSTVEGELEKEDKSSDREKGIQRKKRLTFCVEGNISVGKSTFLQKIANETLELRDLVEVVPEPVGKWQDIGPDHFNILNAFYEEPQRYAYTFQNYVFVTRLMQERESAKGLKPLRLMERSVFSDRMVFVRAVHEAKWMSEMEISIYDSWFDPVVSTLPGLVPDAFIYMRASPDTCHRRLQMRKRPEEQTVTLDYLQGLHEKHEQWLFPAVKGGSKVLSVSNWPHEAVPSRIRDRVFYLEGENVHSCIQKVPALVLDCEATIDFSRDVEAKAEYAKQVAEFFEYVQRLKGMETGGEEGGKDNPTLVLPSRSGLLGLDSSLLNGQVSSFCT